MFSFVFLSPSLAPPPSVSHSFILSLVLCCIISFSFRFIHYHYSLCVCVLASDGRAWWMLHSFISLVSPIDSSFGGRRPDSRHSPHIRIYILVNLIFCFIALYFSRFSYTKHSCNHFSRRRVRLAALAITHKNIVFQINYFPASVCECLLAAAAAAEQHSYPVGKLLLIRNLRQSYLSSWKIDRNHFSV